MFIILDTENQELFDKLVEKLSTEGRTVMVNEWTMPMPADVDVVMSRYPVAATDEDSARSRYFDWTYATLGARYWGSSEYSQRATYAGEVSDSEAFLDQVITDAKYAEARWNLFKNFKVSYTGPTYTDPHAILLVDHKRKENSHDPAQRKDIEKIIDSLPADWWSTTAIVSCSSTKRLESMFDKLEYSVPVATSTGAKSKLSFMGLKYVTALPPKEATPEFGAKLRDSVLHIDA